MAMDLGDADASSVVASDTAPVLALAGTNAAFVLHWQCGEHADTDEECGLMRTDLAGLSGGNALLITSAGNWVVATDKTSRELKAYHVDAEHGVDGGQPLSATIDGTVPARLLASLRNSDWVIGRDLDGRLVRVHPRPSGFEIHRLAPQHDDMMLAAVGEEFAIGRVVLDGEREELYLLRVDVPLGEQADPVHLSTERIASRIVITPRDEFLAVTYGEGDNALTKVFRLPDGKYLQGWEGAMVSGRAEGGELPGIRAVSPDGSHIAYRTEQGSLAMRSLDAHSSCLVHSSRHDSSTRLAGFSADGVLYFETDDGPGRSAVNAWTPHTKERRRLSSADLGYVLASVPARPAEDGEEVPWAVGMREGNGAALQADREPARLGLDEAVFMQRDDADIWTLTTEELDNHNRRVGLRRIVPRWSNQMRALAFDEPSVPRYTDVATNEEEILVEEFSGPSRVCISTGAPGSWAYSCGNASDKNFLAAPTTPSSENPFGKPRDDPEVPSVDDNVDCGAGHPKSGSCGGDEYEVGSCCFGASLSACYYQNCPDACDVTFPSGGEPGRARCIQ